MDKPITNASFRAYLKEGKLMATRCAACGEVHVPPRAICPKCHTADMRWEEAPTRGTLAAFTSVYVAPSTLVKQGFGKDNPYCVGIVELSGGARVNARLEGLPAKDPSAILIGTPMELDLSGGEVVFRAITN